MLLAVGNLTKDAETKDVSGHKATNFTIAQNRQVKKDGQWTKVAEYIDCTAWDRPDLQKILVKGAKVLVIGEVYPEIKKDGTPCLKVKRVLDVELVSMPKPNGQAAPARSGHNQDLDDIPF